MQPTLKLGVTRPLSGRATIEPMLLPEATTEKGEFTVKPRLQNLRSIGDDPERERRELWPHHTADGAGGYGLAYTRCRFLDLVCCQPFTVEGHLHQTNPMSPRVSVPPALFLWACARNQRDVGDYEERFPQLVAWVNEEEEPTLKQLEEFARTTSTPIGFFFLAQPPEEELPIRDFRTLGSSTPKRPTPELLDTIRDCQARQEWYREFALSQGEPKLGIVGSALPTSNIEEVASQMRNLLGFGLAERRSMKTLDEAFSRFAERIEEAGILVMRSGIVGSNTHRKLDPEEFRGFALVDDYAPVVFVNGSDAKTAQIFTLAHELAHVWLGQSGVSDERPDQLDGDATEAWCNQVAAELLVPAADLQRETKRSLDLVAELPRLSRLYKVSTLVVLRRLYELGRLSRSQFRAAYEQELARATKKSGDSGGNFYKTIPIRVSKRFARAVVASTIEGQTLYTDAFRMLGLKSTNTFDGLAMSLGIG
jgi:Zn-dependent peptidase ImmA (M78 family)